MLCTRQGMDPASYFIKHIFQADVCNRLSAHSLFTYDRLERLKTGKTVTACAGGRELARGVSVQVEVGSGVG